MTGTSAAAPAEDRTSAITLAEGFLARPGDAVAALRAAGARVDDSFADAGSFPFEVPGVAVRGSVLAIDRAGRTGAAPEALTLVLPAEPRLTLDAVRAALGRTERAPGQPGAPWLYLITVPAGRYRVAMSGDPDKGARVVSLTAIRER